ncbi:hypothetical protein S83_042591 [Arachis hypogaea]
MGFCLAMSVLFGCLGPMLWAQLRFIHCPLDFGRRFVTVGCDPTVIAKEEVSKNVSRLMGGPLGDQLKTTIKEIKKKMEDALSPSGSSEKNMEYFIKDLNTKSHGQ